MKLMIDARYTRIGVHDGISRYTASLLTALKELQDDGHPAAPEDLQLAMVISDERQLEMLPELPHVKICSPTSPLEPTAALQINRYGPEVVFSPMQTLGLGGWGRKFKLILTLHDLIYYAHPNPPGFLPAPVRAGWRVFHTTYAPQRFLLNRADAVVTVSETTAGLMRQHNLTSKPLHVVPNAPQSRIKSQDQALSLLPQRTKDLIYMGSFMPYKNVETLVAAMGSLPDYTLHLLSRISPARQRELELKAGPNIVFHNGVDEEAYTALLSTAAALLTASKDEGYGLPVVEAQSAGCPVVLSDIPIFREIAPSAFFANANSPSEFARAVRDLEDPQEAKYRVEAGLADAARYSWHTSAIKLLNLLGEL